MSGSLFVVAAPSGAGKSSLVNALLARDANLSCRFPTRPGRCARARRSGRDYHFVSRDDFLRCASTAIFSKVPRCMAISTEPRVLDRGEQMRGGRDIMFEIDCQGAAAMRSVFPTWSRVHPAAVDGRTGAALTRPRHRQRGRCRPSTCRCRGGDAPGSLVRLCYYQRRIFRGTDALQA